MPCDTYDLAVVLGGDGTMLRTAHLIGEKDIPILGINFGNLGFLTNPREVGIEKLIDAAFDRKLKRESRSHLLIKVLTNTSQYTFIALNEVSIRRTESGRIVNFAININDEHVCDLRGDGVIASTATGSTAYALSAGGPLVAPTYKGVIIVPLAPFTLNSRPLVTDAKDVVNFDFSKDAKPEKLSISVDGELMAVDGAISNVVVEADRYETTILRYDNETFYSRISRVFF